MTCVRRQRGFTLLEMVLAMSIAVLLIGGVFGFYRYALAARQSLIDSADRIAFRQALMDRLTRELRGAISYAYLNMGISGSTDQIEFITSAVPARYTWEEPAIGEAPRPPQFDLRRVGYRLAVDDESADPPVVVGLERTAQTLLTESLTEEGQQVRVKRISDYYRFLRFRYYDGTDWQDQWNGARLPQAVEITLGVEPLAEGMLPEEYPGETWRRVVFIPASRLKAGATRIQGLGEGGRP